MITLAAFVALTLAFVQAADANNSLVATGYSAQIEKLVGSDSFPVEANQIRGGQVVIDTDNQTVTLTVQKDSPVCVGSLICPPKLNDELHLQLPIVKVEREKCGVITYTAEQQTTSGRQIINVRDNSNYDCRNFMMLPKTTVSIVKETRNGQASALFAASLLLEKN